MKKFILFYLLIIPGLSCLINSCSIKDEDPQTELTPGSFYKTAVGYRALINGCYSKARDIFDEREDYLYISDLGTDIWRAGIDGKPINDEYRIDYDGNDSYTTRLWNNLYIAVNHANNGVYYADFVEGMNDTERYNLKGQACFLRALWYYIIVETWGGVHLSLLPTEGVELEANKTPVDKFYDAIIKDLEFAMEHLPEQQSNWGMATQYAAMHLLSKVLLTDSRSSKEEYNRALELAETIINSGNHTLLDKRDDVFNYYNQKNKEILWSVQFPEDEGLLGNGGRMNVFFVCKYDNVPGLVRSTEYHRPYTRLAPTHYYMSLWDQEKDARYEYYFRNVYYCNIRVKDRLEVGDTALYFPTRALTAAEKAEAKYTYYEPNAITTSHYPSLRKWDDPTRKGPNDNIGRKDHIVFRLAETYLLAAEAYWRLGDEKNAIKNINVIRKKAAKPGKEATMEIGSATLQEVKDLLLVERALELGGEQNRWYDLKRFGVLLEYVKSRREETQIQEFHLVRPIPITLIDRTKNEYLQNPGYVN